jgi:hypothetical protein
MVKLPGAAESRCPPHHRTPVPIQTGVRHGHATADRMAAGVISLTGGWTERGCLTPLALRPPGKICVDGFGPSDAISAIASSSRSGIGHQCKSSLGTLMVESRQTQ